MKNAEEEESSSESELETECATTTTPSSTAPVESEIKKINLKSFLKSSQNSAKETTKKKMELSDVFDNSSDK